MNQTTRFFSLFLLISLVISPLHAITYRTWQGITCLGAAGGAIAGVMLFNKLATKNTTNEPQQSHEPEYEEVLIIGKKGIHQINHADPEERDFMKKIGSGLAGASVGALLLGWWFWSKTPFARHAAAQEIVHNAELNNLITVPVDLANEYAMQEAVWRTYGNGINAFTRAANEVAAQERHLNRAQDLCMDATTDARDAALMADIGRTQVRIGELLAHIRGRAQAIRNTPAYLQEMEDAARARAAQEEARRQAEQRRAEAARNAQWARGTWSSSYAYVDPFPMQGTTINSVFINTPTFQPLPLYPAPQANYHVHVHNTPSPVIYSQPAPVVYTQPAPRPAPIYIAPTPAPAARPHAPITSSAARLLNNANNNTMQGFAGTPSVNVMPIGNAFKSGSSVANYFGKK